MNTIRRIVEFAKVKTFAFKCIAIGAALALVASACVIQLASTQLIGGRQTAQAATANRTLTVTLSAKRGRILDANGSVLAQSVERYTIVANPEAAQEFEPITCNDNTRDYCHEIDGKPVGATGAAAVGRLLAKVLDMNAMELGADLSGTGQYVILKKDVTPQVKRSIDDLSLTIPDGRFTVITGPNGGGKSTLAKLIMGVERATSGQILLDGEDITDLSISERAKKGIGYGFQQPARFKGMKVKKLLDIAAGKKLPMLACNEYLAKVGLCSASYLTREVDKNLSGGEVKRIEIATILARDPKLAIYDEPEAGIDLWSFDRLTETFRDIHEARDGRSIVIISHQERIIQLADEIVLLRNGKVAETGTPEELMPKLGFVAKGIPGCQLSTPTELHLTEIATTC